MSFRNFLIFIFIIVLFVCLFFPPIFYSDGSFLNDLYDSSFFFISSDEYLWPAPGYTSINSYFGSRDAPTSGASSYHSGIDIGAPENSKIIAITSGTITFASFLGGGGYTITLSTGNMKITYCHVSPNYIVKVGDVVQKGQVIGYVGPKNVYGVPGNFYYDEYGEPTNGATTGPHLHLGVRINDEYIDPLTLYQ